MYSFQASNYRLFYKSPIDLHDLIHLYSSLKGGHYPPYYSNYKLITSFVLSDKCYFLLRIIIIDLLPSRVGIAHPILITSSVPSDKC